MSCRIVIAFMLSAKNGANIHIYDPNMVTLILLIYTSVAYNSLANSTVKVLLSDTLAGSIIRRIIISDETALLGFTNIANATCMVLYRDKENPWYFYLPNKETFHVNLWSGASVLG